MGAKTWEFEALTDIWTGDIDGRPDRLITTGLLGSIRWWFEVVVRGLGGYACDPSARRKTCQDRRHCVVCELFGCTGWARKFRFDVLEDNGRPRRDQIKQGDPFTLRFTPLRPIRDEEWVLLDLTLRFIAAYAAIGGKTVYKPTEQDHRKALQHHQDYGLVQLTPHPGRVSDTSRAELESYVTGNDRSKPGHGKFGWASLQHFWCIADRTLARQSKDESAFNRVLGRKEPKRSAGKSVSNDAPASWLAGEAGQSKKVFSFQDPARTFGFVNPPSIDHQAMKKRLRKAWHDLQEEEYQVGQDILDRLLASMEVSS